MCDGRAFPFQSLHYWTCSTREGETGLLGNEFAPPVLAVVKRRWMEPGTGYGRTFAKVFLENFSFPVATMAPELDSV